MVFDFGESGRVEKFTQEELKKLLEEPGEKERISERLAYQRRNFEFFEKHAKELLKKYPDEWVAVYNEEVVGSDKDFLVLLGRLTKAGMSTAKVIIQLIETNPTSRILLEQGVAV